MADLEDILNYVKGIFIGGAGGFVAGLLLCWTLSLFPPFLSSIHPDYNRNGVILCEDGRRVMRDKNLKYPEYNIFYIETEPNSSTFIAFEKYANTLPQQEKQKRKEQILTLFKEVDY